MKMVSIERKIGVEFVTWDRLPACHIGTDRLEAYPTYFPHDAQLTMHDSHDRRYDGAA